MNANTCACGPTSCRGFVRWFAFLISSLGIAAFPLRAQDVEGFTAPTGLAAWWPMDDPTNQVTVLDWAGSHHGTARDAGSNPVPIGSPGVLQLPDPSVLGGGLDPMVVDPTTSPPRGALFLDGAAVEIPHDSDLDIGPGGLTILLWVWPSQGQPHPQPLIDKFDPVTRQGYSLYLDWLGNDTYALKLNLNGTIHTGPVVPAAVGPDGWRFIVAGVTPPGLVVLGAADLQGNWSTNASFALFSYQTSNQVPLWIGHSPGGVGAGPVRARGLALDEVEIFNRGLSPSEVVLVYGLELIHVRKCASQTGSAELCIHKFEDLNANGTKAPNEPGLPGWQFAIFPPPLFMPTNVVTTDASGTVCVALPAPANFTITELTQPGWSNTTPVSQFVSTVPGQLTNLYFGNVRLQTSQTAQFCLDKFWDRNGNFMRDPSEPLLAGWTFEIRDTNGVVVQTVVSQTNTVCVDVPAPGVYTIAEILPPPVGNWQPWAPTYPFGGVWTNIAVVPGDAKHLSFGNRLNLKILTVSLPSPLRLALQIAAAPGTTLQVQVRPSLAPGAPWEDWGEPVPVTNALTTLEVPLEAFPQQAFFRVVAR